MATIPSGRRNGRETASRITCPGCGRAETSCNGYGTIAKHDRRGEPGKVCAASGDHKNSRPSRFVVCCSRCGGAPWAPEDWCEEPMHSAPPVRVR